MSLARVAAALVALVVSSACTEDIFSPPEGTQRFNPPEAYRTAWARVEDCSGLHGDFNRVRWHLVPGWGFECPEGGAGSLCWGLWEEPHDIYLGRYAVADSPSYFTVRHEMLHDLLGPGRGHPPVFSTCGLLNR